ncbi:Transposon Ty3-G Gag-Pol polyprotein [Labeo rohita]|uniref:ribonuclease H n=1 Tax=Labeo rohita TaxID=84645 RepID=A0ABQ8LAP3_LABRO|nr:Transposon Ty3-G Gag-Pol polyprotein [Labeo rohita]
MTWQRCCTSLWRRCPPKRAGPMANVFLAPTQPVAVIANRIKHKHSQKGSKIPLQIIKGVSCHQDGQLPEPIIPLATRAEAWQAIPGVSDWVMGIIKKGYSLQFARRPPHFSGVVPTMVKSRDAHVLRSEVLILLEKGAIEVVHPAQSESGFYSRYFLVPKKDGGLRPILDLRHLNRALMKRPFKMLTLKQILSHVRPGDWFLSLDLKDAYFHIQIAPHHRRFLRFAFEGVAYQYTVLPFGLSLASRTFTKCMDAALFPLRQKGIRILNYLDDWLVLAQSEAELLSHKALLLSHLECLGLRVNLSKSVLHPSQQISFLGAIFDSTQLRAMVVPERALAIRQLAGSFRAGALYPLKRFQRMLGLMASASPVLELLLDKGRSPSTLKVYVAAIAAFHALIAGQSIGRNNLVVRFLKGSRRINPSRPHTIPTWDLSTVLRALKSAPFEPMSDADLKPLTLKTALLLALVSVKRVGDLQALSIGPSCLEFGPGDSKVILKPRHGYVPKVPSTPFRAQVVTLSALPSSEGDQESALSSQGIETVHRAICLF